MDSLYHELILDLYRHPLNKVKPDMFNISYKENNPLCGDYVEYFIDLNDNQIKKIGWLGEGCAISQAAASLLSDFVKGKTREEIQGISEKEVLQLLNLKDLNPTRLRCATLPLVAIQKGLEK